jgi:hypothetical protein
MAERNVWLAARKNFGAWCAALSLLGCSATPPAVAPVREHWIPSYVFGIWGKGDLDVRDDCPSSGAARVRIGATWSTLLVSVVTLGMYTPHEVIVHCQVGP